MEECLRRPRQVIAASIKVVSKGVQPVAITLSRDASKCNGEMSAGDHYAFERKVGAATMILRNRGVAIGGGVSGNGFDNKFDRDDLSPMPLTLPPSR